MWIKEIPLLVSWENIGSMASMSRRQLIEISAELNASANRLFRAKTQCSGVKKAGASV